MPSRTHATLAVTAPRDTPRTVRPLRALLLCLPPALVGCGAAPVVGGPVEDVAGGTGGTATPVAAAVAGEGTGAGSGVRTGAGTDARVGRAALGATLDARGQEPPWSLQLLAGSLVLERGHDGRGLVATLRESRPLASGGTRHVATGDGVEVRVDVAPSLCRDTMGDLPYPTGVEVSVTEEGESETLRGCGGDPVELLGVGREWTVERVEGDGAGDGEDGAGAGPAPTIAFGADGRASGSTGCNRWSGAWTLTGEALSLERISSTRRACRGATGAREARFLGVLEGVRTFDVRGDGALVLGTSAGETIVARASDG